MAWVQRKTSRIDSVEICQICKANLRTGYIISDPESDIHLAVCDACLEKARKEKGEPYSPIKKQHGKNNEQGLKK